MRCENAMHLFRAYSALRYCQAKRVSGYQGNEQLNQTITKRHHLVELQFRLEMKYVRGWVSNVMGKRTELDNDKGHRGGNRGNSFDSC